MASGAYVDTSVLVKLYVREPGSAEAITLILGLEAPLPLTPFQELEIRTAMRLKQGRGELTELAANAALGEFQADVSHHRYRRPSCDLQAVFHRAEALSSRHASQSKCRTLDLLHVATALEIGSREFVSLDTRQRAVAQAEGLSVRPA